MVASGRTRNQFRQVRSRISEWVPRSSRTCADQSRRADAKWIFGYRQLDGGRNPVAREDRTVGSGGRSILSATCAFAPRDALCRERIVAHHRPQLFGSASELAYSSKMETRRRLPAPSVGFAEGNDWRANDGLVSEVSKNNHSLGHVHHNLMKSRRA